MATRTELPLNVPDIGDADKIELVSWNVEAGAQVNAGDELCELVTDKAAFPLEAPRSGTVTSILMEAGSTVKVGDTLAKLEVED